MTHHEPGRSSRRGHLPPAVTGAIMFGVGMGVVSVAWHGTPVLPAIGLALLLAVCWGCVWIAADHLTRRIRFRSRRRHGA